MGDNSIYMINAQRLSKIIRQQEDKKVQNYLLELYGRLSSGKKKIIREDMQKIQNETLSY